ncbi:MAG: hypothetical protein DI551_05415 [Micavibrio aeruginosavorus]|uniref:Uncharacterized protein n=1 Tax=Micavibrio aeruginosavorus TaxID=349221 RepID=A0A2W5PUZ1_9BACT|nr:MAG: hypothetical protein DI551_05415 [Micavibrio aeruginosavorus]
MAKRVKALDKETGALVSILKAAAVTEGSRYAYEYECRHNGCHCKFHWRKAVHHKGNIEIDAPTFVKNPGSEAHPNEHMQNCPGDIKFIQQKNSDYTTIKDGRIHVRVNFPLGSSKADRYPERGYLTLVQVEAARGEYANVKPFSTLADLTKFIEQNFESLESDEAEEIAVVYQGKPTNLHNLYHGPQHYEDLFYASQMTSSIGDLKTTRSVFAAVKPIKEISRNDKGRARFECEGRDIKIDGRKRHVTPVIVCEKDRPEMEQALRQHLQSRTPLLIAARPFNSSMLPTGEYRVSLFVHSPAQIAPLSEKYWHKTPTPPQQLDFFRNGPQQP